VLPQSDVAPVWLAGAVKPIDVAVSRLAARQYSLAHRHQLLDLGMSPRQIQARLNAGWLMPMHQSVYLVGTGASSPEQAVMAAYLATGSEAVASHRCAAALWGLRGVEAPEPEITLWADRHRPLRGVVVHRTRELDAVDISRVRRIPVTTPARTLLDLGAVAPAEVVEPALEDALMRRMVTFKLLLNTLERLGGSGRNGAGVLRALVEERDPATAPTQSMLEDLLYRVIRRGGLPAPVRQYEVAGVRLDGAFPHVRLGIEADSRVWHGGRLDVQRNATKANILLAHGWRVLRFTWFDLTRRAGYVVGSIGQQLALACPA
jgi:very-short-patch-repair endonuclease